MALSDNWEMALSDSWEKMTQEEREDACSGNEDRIMVCPHCGYQNHFTEFVDPGNSDSGLAGCPVCCKDFEWVAETVVYFRTFKRNQQKEHER